MHLSLAWIGTAFLLAALPEGAAASGQPTNTTLLSLVPPESQIVVGSVAPQHERYRGAFLIFARANTLDLEDFFSLVGADASHRIDQVVFAASTGHGGGDPEHSLLVVGHFDHDQIRRPIAATSSEYRGFSLIVVHPFARERALLRDDRLLVIMNSSLAIFGTTLSVRQEIDRYLDGTPADNSLLQRLSSLRNEDQIWCLISSLLFSPAIPRVLKKLDPAFGEIDKNTDTLLFGILFGREIEFEYVIQTGLNAREAPASRPPMERSCGPANKGLCLASEHGVASGNEYRRVVKMSRARYEKWLADLRLY